MRTDDEAKKIWFSGDLHFLHPKIVDIFNRPINKKDHDEWLIDRFNSVIGKYDELYLLGDISLGPREESEELIKKLHGNKHLIIGNHDKNIKNSKEFIEITQIKNFNFSSKSFPNVHIVLCHYPLASWERKSYNSFHLFAHEHGRYKNTKLSMDVGVDCNNYMPISLDFILNKYKKFITKGKR